MELPGPLIAMCHSYACVLYLWVASVVTEKSLLALGRFTVVAQQFDDALLLRQRHASLNQTLWSLPQHDSLLRRNLLASTAWCILASGCWGRPVNLLPQHAVDAAAARRLNTECVEVVQTQNVAQIHKTRTSIFLQRVGVFYRLLNGHLGCILRCLGRHFAGRGHTGSTSGGGNWVKLAHGDKLLMLRMFPSANRRHEARWRHWMMKLISWRHCALMLATFRRWQHAINHLVAKWHVQVNSTPANNSSPWQHQTTVFCS